MPYSQLPSSPLPGLGPVSRERKTRDGEDSNSSPPKPVMGRNPGEMRIFAEYAALGPGRSAEGLSMALRGGPLARSAGELEKIIAKCGWNDLCRASVDSKVAEIVCEKLAESSAGKIAEMLTRTDTLIDAGFKWLEGMAGSGMGLPVSIADLEKLVKMRLWLGKHDENGMERGSGSSGPGSGAGSGAGAQGNEGSRQLVIAINNLFQNNQAGHGGHGGRGSAALPPPGPGASSEINILGANPEGLTLRQLLGRLEEPLGITESAPSTVRDSEPQSIEVPRKAPSRAGAKARKESSGRK